MMSTHDTYTYATCVINGENRRYKRTLLYGIVTLHIDEHEFPVHRDILANHYSFFKDLDPGFDSVKLDRTIVTPEALDYLLCFHYPDAEFKDPLTFALYSEVIVAWDFFGGGLEAKEAGPPTSFIIGPPPGWSSQTTIALVVNKHMLLILNEWKALRGSTYFEDIRKSPYLTSLYKTVLETMKRHPDIFGKTAEQYEEFMEASPERRQMISAREELRSMRPRVPLEGLTKQDLMREFGKRTSKSKDEVSKLVADQRAQKAFEILQKTCGATESARRELFQDMVRTHQVDDDDPNICIVYNRRDCIDRNRHKEHFYMLANGSILRTTNLFRFSQVKPEVIDGPHDVTMHFFYDIGMFPGFIHVDGDEFRCIKGSVESLSALHVRFVELYETVVPFEI